MDLKTRRIYLLLKTELTNMKKHLIRLSLLAFIGTIITSCNKEVDLVGDFKETAVVYGLLDKSDSVHMIKITRAFIGPGNSLEIAQIADSSYFQNVDATITEYVSGTLTRTWTLDDTIISNKNENGVFYAPEQKLYYFATSSSQPLLSNAVYKLKIVVNNGLFEVNGETSLVSGITTTTDSPTYAFKFAQLPGEYKSTTVGVNTGNSHIVNASLDFTFAEHIGAAESNKTLTWKLGEVDVDPGTTQNFTAVGETFYNLVNSACSSSDPNVDKRRIIGITVRVVGGSEELYNYMLVNKPSSTLAQSKPTYTNLTSTNDHPVIGIFSSRFTYSVFHPFIGSSSFARCIDKNSTRELCIGSITGTWLFCSDHDQDNFPTAESWACN